MEAFLVRGYCSGIQLKPGLSNGKKIVTYIIIIETRVI